MFRSTLALALVTAFFAGIAAAGPKEVVHDAFVKFLAVKSFRADVTDVNKQQPISTMMFVAPDRYHIRTGQGGTEQTIIGDDAYTTIEGRTMKLPIPVGKIIGQYRNQATLAQLEQGMTVTSAGSDSVDGELADAYSYTITEPVKADVKVWISQKSGLPIQIESQGRFLGVKSTTRVKYYDFDDAGIRIDAPN
ncbi:MAG TPA: hypothetical protein VM555_09620 [Tahibacter sp.]|nr:hypothetical protein [Tahibacter sp.]